MSTVNLGDEDIGIVNFKYKGKEIPIDVFELCQKIQDLKKSTQTFSGIPTSEGVDIDLVGEIQSLFKEYGFEGISRFTTGKVLTELTKLTDELKKNIDLTH